MLGNSLFMTLNTWVTEAVGKSVMYKLLWKGSRDGFTPEKFHGLCNNKGPILLIVMSSNGNVFGGYTSLSWKDEGSGCHHYEDKYAFVYSLTHNAKFSEQKRNSNSICFDSRYGPVFGCGSSSLCIRSDFSKSYSWGNSTYGIPNDEYLAGTKEFSVKEIEVYSVRQL